MLCANKNIRDMCFWLGEGKPERKFSQTCHITEENMKKPKRKCSQKSVYWKSNSESKESK